MADLSSKRARDRLPVRREPHWQRLRRGAYLGFRRGPDTWIARFRTRDGRQVYNALEGAQSFDEAKARAEDWFEQMGSHAVREAKQGTVREALEFYLRYLREHGRKSAADTSEQRFKAIVWNDPLAEIALRDLTRDDMREWRTRLREGRLPRTVNRHVRSIVAGLNLAQAEGGFVGNPDAWKLKPLADDVEESGETAVLLTPEQRKGLILGASKQAALFFRGLEMTGARPGELAAATVADFDAAQGTITLRHRKGRPARLRPRVVVLSVEGTAFFADQAKGKTPKAPLFTDAEGKPWERHEWAREFREAVAKHNKTAKGKKRVPAGASAYSFRHARISELLQVHGLDPLTVAAQTGTSVAMLEKAYFRFIPTAMRDKLARIKEA